MTWKLVTVFPGLWELQCLGLVWALGIIQPAVWAGCFPNTSVAWAETEGISVDVWKSSLNCRSYLSFPKSQSHVDLAHEDRSAQHRYILTWKVLPNRKLCSVGAVSWLVFYYYFFSIQSSRCFFWFHFLVPPSLLHLFPGPTLLPSVFSLPYTFYHPHCFLVCVFSFHRSFSSFLEFNSSPHTGVNLYKLELKSAFMRAQAVFLFLRLCCLTM